MAAGAGGGGTHAAQVEIAMVDTPRAVRDAREIGRVLSEYPLGSRWWIQDGRAVTVAGAQMITDTGSVRRVVLIVGDGKGTTWTFPTNLHVRHDDGTLHRVPVLA